MVFSGKFIFLPQVAHMGIQAILTFELTSKLQDTQAMGNS